MTFLLICFLFKLFLVSKWINFHLYIVYVFLWSTWNFYLAYYNFLVYFAGSLPEVASHPQETTIISMSAPISSVSTDSGSRSTAQKNHSRQADRVARKARHVQGVQPSILSPGSASSLRRSPRIKVQLYNY